MQSYVDLDAIDWRDLLDFDSVAEADLNAPAKLTAVVPTNPCSVAFKATGKIAKNNSKKRHNVIKSFKKGMTVTAAISAQGPMPNMSRRMPTNVLVAFPLFDKCDSLVYFPHSFARHMNTGDTIATTKLFTRHADSNCQVIFKSAGVLYVRGLHLSEYIDNLQLGEDVEPDRMMCVHSTKVVNNQIKSVIYMKVTDSQIVYDSVCSSLPNEDWKRYAQRLDRFNMYANQEGLDPSVRQAVLHHAEANDDVLIYMRVDLTFTFDHDTKKIVCFESDYHLTSIHPVHNNCSNMN